MLGLVAAALGVAGAPAPAPAAPVTVTTDAGLTAAWADRAVTEIVLGADIELGCSARVRGPGSAALVLDGAGHVLTDTCTTNELALGSTTDVTISDIEIVGRLGAATYSSVVQLSYATLRLEAATITSRSPGGIAVSAGAGSEIVGSTLVAEDGGDALWVEGSALVERSSITSGDDGIEPFDVTDGDLLVVRETSVVSGGNAVAGAVSTVVERSSLRGGAAAVAGNGSFAVADSTLVVAPEVWPTDGSQPAPLRVGRDGRATVVRSTISSEGGDPAGRPGAIATATGAVVELRGSVLAVGDGDVACRGDGTVASLGGNVAAEASCALAGPGDLVADPLLPPVALDADAAVPPPESPVVDHVPADLCGGGTDQSGVPRPQGPACDAGAIELAVDRPDPGPGPGPSGPGGQPGPRGPAPPATPVVARARFTG